MSLTLALLFAMFTSAALPAQDSGDFAFNLFKKVAAANPEKNIFLSPSSARWALGMAYAGSAGTTKKAIGSTLRAFPPAENLKAESERITSLMSADPQVVLRVANSIWMKRGFPFKKKFVSSVSAAYRAEVFERDFGPSDVTEVNAWVKNKTEGKIPTILDRFASAERAVLINAVYFKGTWRNPFNKERTTPEDFHLAAGNVVKRPLMDRTGDYPYFAGSGFQALRLPFGGGRLGMIVLLPARDRTLKSLIATTAEAAAWRTIQDGLTPAPVHVRLPLFKTEYRTFLRQPLSELGMGVAFDPKKADFTLMADAPSLADRLYISNVLQKTFVEVNEAGAEAAAATATTMTAGAMLARRPIPPPPFEFLADRPFIYAIEDRETGEILFLGSLYDPG
jgi:serpin B